MTVKHLTKLTRLPRRCPYPTIARSMQITRRVGLNNSTLPVNGLRKPSSTPVFCFPSLLLIRSDALALGLGYHAQHVLLPMPETRPTPSATVLSPSSGSNCTPLHRSGTYDERKDVEGRSQSWLKISRTAANAAWKAEQAKAIAAREVAFEPEVEGGSGTGICGGDYKTGHGSDDEQETTHSSRLSACSTVAHPFASQRETLRLDIATTTDYDVTSKDTNPSKGGEVTDVTDPRRHSDSQPLTPPLTPLTPAPPQASRGVSKGSPGIDTPGAGKVPTSVAARAAGSADTCSQLQHDTRQQHVLSRFSEPQPPTPPSPPFNPLQLLMPIVGSKTPISAQPGAPNSLDTGVQQQHKIREQRDDDRTNHGSHHRTTAGSCGARSDTGGGGAKVDGGGAGKTQRGSVHLELDDAMALQLHEGLVSAMEGKERQGTRAQVRGGGGHLLGMYSTAHGT